MHVLSSGMVGAPSRDANGRVWALPHCPVCWCVAVLCGGTLYVESVRSSSKKKKDLVFVVNLCSSRFSQRFRSVI